MDREMPDKPKWELYNLAQDRSEKQNLAAAYPDKVSALEATWQQELRKVRAMAELK